MDAIGFLTGLEQARHFSRILDYRFALNAHRRGIVEAEEIENLVPLLIAEVDQIGDAEARAFLETLRGDPTLEIMRHPVAAGPAKRERLEKIMPRAAEALRILSMTAPSAADAMRPWHDKLVAAATELSKWSVVTTADRQSLETRFRILEELALAELDQQRIAEQMFWSGIDMAVIAHVNDEEAEWLLNTHSSFEAALRTDKPGNPLSSFDLDALFVQVPILSAALASGLDQLMIRYRIVELGPTTIVDIDNMPAPLVISTPQYAAIGDILRMQDERSPGDGVVALPVGPAQIGRKRWQELMQSPLVAGHSSKLLPSGLFWGDGYPASAPAQKQLTALVETIFPAASLPPGQVLRAQVHSVRSRGRYGITVTSGAAPGHGRARNVSLELDIADGKMVAAKYVIHGIEAGHDLAVVVDEARLERLVARGRKDAAQPPSGGSTGSAKTALAPTRSFGGVEPEREDGAQHEESSERSAQDGSASPDPAAPAGVRPTAAPAAPPAAVPPAWFMVSPLPL